MSATSERAILEERARFLVKTIANRLDVFAVAEPHGPAGPKVAPAIPFATREPAERFERGETIEDDKDERSRIRKEGRLALIAGHLAAGKAPPVYLAVETEDGRYRVAGPGRYRIGFFTRGEDGKTKWTCVEFDGAGHAGGRALVDAEGVALAAYTYLHRIGLPCFLERSEGGRGYRVWIFYETRKEAALARRIGLAACPKGVLLADGERADPERGHGITVFPQSEDVEPSVVFAPWFHGAEPSTGTFVRPVLGGGFEERDPWAE